MSTILCSQKSICSPIEALVLARGLVLLGVLKRGAVELCWPEPWNQEMITCIALNSYVAIHLLCNTRNLACLYGAISLLPLVSVWPGISRFLNKESKKHTQIAKQEGVLLKSKVELQSRYLERAPGSCEICPRAPDYCLGLCSSTLSCEETATGARDWALIRLCPIGTQILDFSPSRPSRNKSVYVFCHSNLNRIRQKPKAASLELRLLAFKN